MSELLLRFQVAGIPAPQGSKQIVYVKGRPLLINDNSNKLRSWKRTVTAAASSIVRAELGGRFPYRGPLDAFAFFYVPRPKHVPKEREGLPTTRPDGDKLMRAVWDCLTDAKVWVDDAQVIDGRALKQYAAPHHPLPVPGVIVEVRRAALSEGASPVDVDTTR